MDDETIAELARKKILYVPTIDHNRCYADNAKLLGYRFAMGSDAVYAGIVSSKPA